MNYKPKSAYGTSTYTTGNEFILDEDGEYYTGYYHVATDGNYYTGKVYDKYHSKLLIDSRVTQSSSRIDLPSSVPVFNRSEKIQYRYFAISTINGKFVIQEIKKSDFDSITNKEGIYRDELYTLEKVEWMVIGSETERTNFNQKKLKNTIYIKEVVSNLTLA